MKIKYFSLVRSLGLILVLIYHFFPNIMPGGFIGVDVFFAFSGYLITALIIEKYKGTGGFEYLSFIKRRVLRLMPALVFMLFCTLPLLFLISPDFLVGLPKQTAAALGWVTNFYEMETGGSYEARLLPHLYVHTWSLAVEMHFYIIWGLIAAVVLLLIKKSAKRASLAKKLLFFISLGLAVISYLYMQMLTQGKQDPSAGYMGTNSHAFSIMLGAALGAVLGLSCEERTAQLFRSIPFRILSVLLLIFSMGGLVYLSITMDFSAAFTFKYGLPIAAELSVIMIFSIRALHESIKSFEPWPLATLSDISYSMYLFHWPLYIIFNQLIKNSIWAVIAALIGTIGFSLLSYFFIEKPFGGKLLIKGKAPSPALLPCVALLLFVGIGLSFFTITRVAQPKNSIEQRLQMGYVHVNVSKIENIGFIAHEINPDPLHRFSSEDDGRSSAVLKGITVYGDSVTIGSGINHMRSALLEAFPQYSSDDIIIDAKGSRPLQTGLDLMSQAQRETVLREYVVLALGTNAFLNDYKKVQQFIDELEPGHRLIVVAPYNEANKEAIAVREFMRTLPSKYSFITVADWAQEVLNDKSILSIDKVHAGSSAGMKVYYNCIIKAIHEAESKDVKR
ncbi:MAG: acyltransferase [Oscillospiraceae bacterium]|jgi:peptidoglycan/LPS O-acetylase OafA/YrhL|nr:acyltransferase [Oscillospiraceae bacterium]